MHALALTLLTVLTAAGEPHPLVKPYEGSKVSVPLSVKDFERVEFPSAPGQNKPLTLQTMEGRVLKAIYENPKGRSPLEVFRNYQQALERAGYQVMALCLGKECGRVKSNLFGVVGYPDEYYMAVRGTPEGQDVFVGVYVSAATTIVASVQPKAMETDKVQVTAAQLQEGLEATGHVAVYGILFDTGKAVLKPESEPVLVEIATLVKGQPKLKLHVVGHTDNVGNFDENMNLSRQRAEAVVTALVKRHAVPAAQLRPSGVGPLVPVSTNATDAGRAKNRRVELVQQ